MREVIDLKYRIHQNKDWNYVYGVEFDEYGSPEVQNPPKQGLKPIEVTIGAATAPPEVQNPPKQGLKQQTGHIGVSIFSTLKYRIHQNKDWNSNTSKLSSKLMVSWSTESTKTRIETCWPGQECPQELSPWSTESTKTRIETWLR